MFILAPLLPKMQGRRKMGVECRPYLAAIDFGFGAQSEVEFFRES
jgi:hypothetical protein